MFEYRFRQLTTWPGKKTPATSRNRSPFSAKYSATLKLLATELHHLQARNVVIEADCDARMIRNDGMLRSDARLNGPGIVLSFDSKNGPMRFPCDRFVNWDCNLRAIALTLEHLRAVDRYGVTQHAEQYAGWTALPDRRTAEQTKAAAVTWLKGKAFDVLGLRDVIDANLPAIAKQLKVHLHPDRRVTDAEFKELMQAIEVLGI